MASAALILLLFAAGARADPRRRIIYPGDPARAGYFLHVTDVHVGRVCPGDRADYLERLLAAMDQGALRPAFVICTGDLTEAAACVRDSRGRCLCGTPNGQRIAQWEDYRRLLAGHPASARKFYDIPGNHDRYGSPRADQIDWSGQTGRDGYRYLGLRGSASDAWRARSLGAEGNYGWTARLAPQAPASLFFALNTCDQSGISFTDYQYLASAFGRGAIADMPALSPGELAGLQKALDGFRAGSGAGLVFWFGHHALLTESYDRALPGLFDQWGFVTSRLRAPAGPGDRALELNDASMFPDQGEGWILDDSGRAEFFQWSGREGDRLLGLGGPTRLHPAGALAAGARPDRGALDLFRRARQYQVSAYFYGHTHRPQDYAVFLEHPDLPGARLLSINTGALLDGYYRIAALDNGGFSTRLARLDVWPQVLITAPADSRLGGGNPFCFPAALGSGNNIIRALVLRPPGARDPKVSFTASGGSLDQPCLKSGAMAPVPGVADLYQARLDLAPCGGASASMFLNIKVGAACTDPNTGETLTGEHEISVPAQRPELEATWDDPDRPLKPGAVRVLRIQGAAPGDRLYLTWDGIRLLAGETAPEGPCDLSVKIPADARPGAHYLRFFDESFRYGDLAALVR